MHNTYLCLVQGYCTTVQDRCPKGNSLPLRPESAPALTLPQKVLSFLLGLTHKANQNHSAKSSKKSWPALWPQAPTTLQQFPVPGAKAVTAPCSIPRMRNWAISTSQALYSNLLFDTDILWPTVHMTTHCSDGDETLISRGCSFHAISSPFFPVGSVDIFAGQRIRVKIN